MRKLIANTTAALLMLATTAVSTSISAYALVGGEMGIPTYTCNYNIHGQLHQIILNNGSEECPLWVDDPHYGKGKDTIEECTSTVSKTVTLTPIQGCMSDIC